MKKLIVIILPLLILIACAPNRVKLVNKRHFKEHKEKIQRSIDQKEDNPSAFVKDIPNTIKSEIESRIDDSHDEAIDQQSVDEAEMTIKETSPSSDTSSISLVENKTRSKSYKDNDSSSTSTALIVAGSILLVAGLILALYFLFYDTGDTSTPDGCLQQLFLIVFFAVIGVVVSVTGLILLIIGIVTFATGKSMIKKRRELKAPKK